MEREPSSPSGDGRRVRLLTAPEWVLGALGALGLVGFAIVLATDRGPAEATRAPPATVQAAPAQAMSGERGPKGERGPAGPAGPPGPAAMRIVRVDCTSGACHAQCEDDEFLVMADCGSARAPAIYPTERSATCRTRRAGPDHLVATCAKVSPP
jgi:hypothetical protein